MDPQSLDAAVQTTLSGLFPPFEVTAPTVLSQLFRVLESKYHGDGLCCLLDFLIPLKRLLEHIRQAACASYSGRVFLHEGWPLCLHEKVTVHLSPLNPLLLRPGDFYLQAEPCGEQSACLVVKCLSRDLTTAAKVPIPDATCSWLFTEAWLENVNRDLEGPTLHTCLVATGNGIVPVPWNKIATPEFVQLPKTEHLMEKDSSHPETLGLLNAEPPSGHSGGDPASRPSPGKYPGLIKVDQGSWKKTTLFVVPSLCDIISENLEGEYVNLVEFSEAPPKVEMSSPAATPHPLQPEALPAAEKKGLLQANGETGPQVAAWNCGKEEDLEAGPCTPCLRRKLSPDPKIHEPRCRYRDSYMAALQNPISINSGLMAAILEEMDLAQAASAPEDGEVQLGEGSGQMASPNPFEHSNKGRKVEEGPKSGATKPAKSPAEGPAGSSKFSFRKGHRPLASPGEGSGGPEKAGKGPEGPRKKTLMVSSPKVARAKPASGKGSSPTEAAFGDPVRPLNLDPVGVTPSNTDALIDESLVLGSSPSESVPWDLLNSQLLSSGMARLPGSVDKLGRPLVEIPQNGGGWQDPGCSVRELTRLLLCLCCMARKRSNGQGVVILVDARKEAPPPTLPTALGSLQKIFPGSIQVLLLVAEKDTTSHLERFLGLQVEPVTSLKALSRHVDHGQLTPVFDGHFPYNHGEWVQFFQKVHHFVSGLKKASELLRTTTQELEKEEALETLQAVERQLSRHRQLMQEVLRNAQLVSLQREGGATLARLRKEAARLGFSPDVRHTFESALAVYNLVEEEVHTLVTKSNGCLEHLEFLKKIRELEEEFNQVSLWIEEEGEAELSLVGLAEGNLENTEDSYRRFKGFFKEATVHYNRGLSLSKEAAKIQGFGFPEMASFEATKGAFQARLTMFYMDMEMKGAELEAFLDLYRFCEKKRPAAGSADTHPGLSRRSPRVWLCVCEKMCRVSLLAFWLCCLVPSSEAINPGFAGRITRKGLDYACQQGVATLQKDLLAITLPEFSGSYRVKVIGNVDYRFYSLNIRRFELPHSTIEPMPGQGVRVSIRNALAEMTGRWQLKKRWLKDQGSFELKVDSISISVGLQLGSDGAGRPTITILDCNTHISSVDIDISGKWEWLYNLFKSKVESAFKTAMESKICDIVRTSVNSKLESHLQSLPVTTRIDNTSSIDYSLVGPPIATSDCVDLDLKGEFFSNAQRTPAPFPPPPLSFPVDPDRMVQFAISTYFFNTAGQVYYQAERLTSWIVDDMVPKEIKIRLNTASFEPFIPQIKKLYPSMPMKLRVSPSLAPSLSISPESISLAPSVDIQAFAILPNSSLAPLFLIEVTTSVSAKVDVNSTRIFGDLKMGRMRFSLKHSDVGIFSVQLLETLINFLTASILIPQMNARLAEGFPLPLLDHLELSNPILQAHQDFLLFASDVRYE